MGMLAKKPMKNDAMAAEAQVAVMRLALVSSWSGRPVEVTVPKQASLTVHKQSHRIWHSMRSPRILPAVQRAACVVQGPSITTLCSSCTSDVPGRAAGLEHSVACMACFRSGPSASIAKGLAPACLGRRHQEPQRQDSQ